MSSSYDVGTRAWQPDATEGWVASEVVKKSVDGNKVILEFKLENEEVRFTQSSPSILYAPGSLSISK
jgi:myosin V